VPVDGVVVITVSRAGRADVATAGRRPGSYGEITRSSWRRRRRRRRRCLMLNACRPLAQRRRLVRPLRHSFLQLASLTQSLHDQ